MGYHTIYTDHSLFGFADAACIHVNKLLKFFLTNVEHCVCVSHTNRENLVLRAALNPINVSVIPNAVDTRRFQPDASQRSKKPWAEETHHKVGGEQRETDAERAVALARGKATASVIGIPAMGQRFNVLMTIQVPLRQAPKRCKMLCSKSAYQMLSYKFHGRARSRSGHARGRGGKSSAARVSRGSEVDIWPGLTVQSPQRHPAEHVTVTVQLYHVVVGGVPSEEDEDGKLADGKFDFLKKPLSLDDLADIPKKVWSQPPEVMDFDVFPV
eukprot:g28176.t1